MRGEPGNIDQVAFFAIPKPHHGEIVALYAQWAAAAFGESGVWYNKIYRRAQEVAVHVAPVSGRNMEYALATWLGFVRKCILPRDPQDPWVLSADETPDLLRRTLKHERDVGGEDEIVRRAVKKSKRLTIDGMREIYRAYLETLRAAVDRDAGLTHSVYEDGAEARLAAHRAQIEADFARGAELMRQRPPRTPEQEAADAARVQAEMDEMVQRSIQEYDEPEEYPNMYVFVIDDDHAVNARRRLRGALALVAAGEHDDLTRANRRFYQARRALGALELYRPRRSVPDKEVHRLVLRALADDLRAANPAMWRDEGVWRRDQARALQAAIEAWKTAHGGKRRALAHVAAAAGTTADHAAAALRAFERQLARAVDHRCAFVWFEDPVRDWSPYWGWRMPGQG